MISAAIETLKALFTKPQQWQNPDGHGIVIVHRDNEIVSMVAGRHENRRGHRFDDVSTFAEWLLRHADARQAEILVAAESIVAGLEPQRDNGDTVSCALALHPTAARWLGALTTQQMSQRDLYRFLMGSLDSFADEMVGDDNLGSYGRLLAGNLQKLKIATKGEYESHLDPRGFWSFVGGSAKTEVSGKLPTSFEITIPWFQGVCLVFGDGGPSSVQVLCSYRLEVLLEMDTADPARPTFRLEAPTLDLLKHGARQDAVKWLRHLLDANAEDDEAATFLVGLGTYKTERVPDVGHAAPPDGSPA